MLDSLSSSPSHGSCRATSASLADWDRGLADNGLRHHDVSALIPVPLVSRLLQLSPISNKPVDGRSQAVLLIRKETVN